MDSYDMYYFFVGAGYPWSVDRKWSDCHWEMTEKRAFGWKNNNGTDCQRTIFFTTKQIEQSAYGDIQVK